MRRGIDSYLLTATLLLIGFSLVMVYSTTGVIGEEKFGDPFFYVKRQAFAVLIGLACLFVCSRLKPEFLAKYSWLGLPLALACLVLTFIPGLHYGAGGAVRWVSIAGFRFQPGELAKLLVVVFMAGYFARRADKIDYFSSGVLVPFMYAGLVGGVFLLQPDFGSAAVVCLIVLTLCLAVGVPIRFIAACGFVAMILAGLAIALSPYRMMRVSSFLTPWQDPEGSGYQLIQSLIAIGSGHISGVGLGESQQKLMFLPAAHTDFIFSVIGEELGFFGCMFVIGVFLVMLWRGLSIAQSLEYNTFSFVLAVGLTMLIVVPAFLNMGVATGVLPTKGMVLPLVAYGGTNLIMSLSCIGILLSLSRR